MKTLRQRDCSKISRHSPFAVLAAFCLIANTVPTAFQTGPRHFIPSGTLSTNLDGWHRLGNAAWAIENGTLSARATRAGGGWLVLDRPLANASFYARFRCKGRCQTGVLLRGKKTAEGGLRGIYVQFDATAQRVFEITLDADGRETARRPLDGTAADGGLPNLVANTPPEVSELMRTKTRTDVALPAGVDLPGLAPAPGKFQPGSWNSLNLDNFQDALFASVNGAPVWGSSIPQTQVPSGFGVIALHVEGAGEAQFEGIAWRDLTQRIVEAEQLSPNYQIRRLDPYYYSWAPAVADFDQDGHPDIAAGPYIYSGPGFRSAVEYTTPISYNPTSEYPQKSTLAVTRDFTGDKWPDILQFTGNAGYISGILYVNPRGEPRHWTSHNVIDLLANEDTILRDIDGDGVAEIVHGGPDYALGYTKPDPANPTGKWITTRIASSGPWGGFTVHGLGTGDINGDGRADIATPYGWWEQPTDGTQQIWTYHPFAFGRAGASQGGPGGAELQIFDVNGDGMNDVVTALEGHGFGLAWYAQRRSAKGAITFERHMIMDNFDTTNAGGVTFTQLHALTSADMDGDGIPDIITGKRPMSHLLTWYDPDPLGAPVLYVYRTVRDPMAPGGARFVPELVHNQSGVGSAITAADLNGDGTLDIATSNALGTFLFLNKAKAQEAANGRR